jgi:hypothetical protein
MAVKAAEKSRGGLLAATILNAEVHFNFIR